MSSCILIRDRFTNERHSTSIGTIGLPRLARFSDRLLKENRNKRSDHLARRETVSYILFSAKTQIYINKTHTESGVEKSLFQFSLRLIWR